MQGPAEPMRRLLPLCAGGIPHLRRGGALEQALADLPQPPLEDPDGSPDGSLLFRPALCKLEHGVQYAGSTVIMKAREASDTEGCARVCLALPECTHFAWSLTAAEGHGEPGARCTARKGQVARQQNTRAASSALTGTCRSASAAAAPRDDALGLRRASGHNCTLEQDVDFDDGIMAFGTPGSAETAEQCAAACSRAEACTHFSWIGFPEAGDKWYKKCYLKSGGPRNRTTKEGIVSGLCDSGPGAGATRKRSLLVAKKAPVRGGSQCSLEVGVDYKDGYGAVFTDIKTPEMCASTCAKLPGCTHFTWLDPAKHQEDDLRSCYLKYGEQRRRNNSTHGVVSGVCRRERGVLVEQAPGGAPSAADDCHIEPGVDYSDDFVAEVRGVTSALDCGGACLLLDGCTHFSWVGDESAGPAWHRNCYLKAGSPTGRRNKSVITSGRCGAGRRAAPTTTLVSPVDASIHVVSAGKPTTSEEVPTRALDRALPPLAADRQAALASRATAVAASQEGGFYRRPSALMLGAMGAIGAVAFVSTGYSVRKCISGADGQSYAPVHPTDGHPEDYPRSFGGLPPHQERPGSFGPSEAELARELARERHA